MAHPSHADTPPPRYIGRFAPSPTGPLHFGSMVAALASFLDARAARGRWLVRIEDVDTPRSVPGAADTILAQLEAHSLAWDGEVIWQSQRTALYEAALGDLVRKGLVYRCTCTRREVADSAIAGIDGPIYPGTCRDKTLALAGEGALRLRVAGSVGFDDALQGHVEHDLPRQIGDFVLKRRDGLFAYQLAVVVDDADQSVTDVVRGADLLDSTPRQIYLQHCLGVTTPRYLHVPIAVNAAGEKLSKQTLAPACAPVDASRTLALSLAFLGQAVPAELAGAPPRELISWAIGAWQHERLPRRRTAPVPV